MSYQDSPIKQGYRDQFYNTCSKFNCSTALTLGGKDIQREVKTASHSSLQLLEVIDRHKQNWQGIKRQCRNMLLITTRMTLENALLKRANVFDAMWLDFEGHTDFVYYLTLALKNRERHRDLIYFITAGSRGPISSLDRSDVPVSDQLVEAARLLDWDAATLFDEEYQSIKSMSDGNIRKHPMEFIGIRCF